LGKITLSILCLPHCLSQSLLAIDKQEDAIVYLRKMNAPLVLTFLRILSIPVIVIILLSDIRSKEIISFVVFALATLTDTLDGFWARRKKQITIMGQLLDPTADKLLVVSVLICLVETGSVPAWMAVVIVSREVAITGFRALASSKGIYIPASQLGKIKMILETGTIGLLLLGGNILGSLYVLSQIGLWLTIVAAIVSAAEYYIKYGPAVISDRS
jgi:CDP-diacylglycerol--glycerol-3-phosphate 3-phosphatidyltransferase